MFGKRLRQLQTLVALAITIPFLTPAFSPGQQQTANELVMLNVTVRNPDGQKMKFFTVL
jgi:hypothetical protein